MDNNVVIKYPFSKQLIFALVMENESLCKEMLERILRGRRIKELKIREKVSAMTEATIITGINSKSVRMDVLFEDEAAWYNIEMQVENKNDLPKRCRYYCGALDVKNLKRGEEYSSLKPSYVIFICQFDYFKKDEALYFFERADLKKCLPMGDESYTIVMNTKCSGKVPAELRSLFDYINEGRVNDGDDFIGRLHEEVIALQGSEEVYQIMTMEEEYERRNAAARREGRAEGEAAATLKLARVMKAKGLDTGAIAEITALSAEEIDKL